MCILKAFALAKHFVLPESPFPFTWKWKRGELPIIDSLHTICSLTIWFWPVGSSIPGNQLVGSERSQGISLPLLPCPTVAWTVVSKPIRKPVSNSLSSQSLISSQVWQNYFILFEPSDLWVVTISHCCWNLTASPSLVVFYPCPYPCKQSH